MSSSYLSLPKIPIYLGSRTQLEPEHWTTPVENQFDLSNYPLGPQTPVSQQFKNKLRQGEIVSTTTTSPQDTASKLLSSTPEEKLQHFRKGAEVHRQTRRFAQSVIRPGMLYSDLVDLIDQCNKRLIEANGLEAGLSFPCGVSVNNCAAHWTPNKGDVRVIKKEDVVKVDFGLHSNGNVIDSAHTICFDPKFNPLLDAAKAGTEAALREAGVDARFSEIGAAVQEAIESYEVEINGQIKQCVPIRNLSGHSVDDYRVHGGRSVPIVKCSEPTRMKEGEFYALETFASTGKGRVVDDGECSHYMLNPDAPFQELNANARALLRCIKTNFGTLAWSKRWVDALKPLKGKSYLLALRTLVNKGIVNEYPPLSDVVGSYVAQFEHTVYIGHGYKEILTRGDDY
ncbi:hypothetical protein P9112_007401 [Eukaryota sp. TZLM1-RC]